MPESTGSPPPNINTEKTEVSLQLERDTEVSELEVTETTTTDLPRDKVGSEEIKSPSEDIVDREYS